MTNTTNFISTVANFSNNTTSDSNSLLYNFYIQFLVLLINNIGLPMLFK